LFLEPHATHATPLVGRRVWPALEFRYRPNRFRARLRPHAARIIERNTKIVAERRLALRLEDFVVPKTPFSGKICLRPRRDSNQGHHGEQKQTAGKSFCSLYISHWNISWYIST